MAQETGTANLEKIDHVVVLMLENRSFDHLLGYLSLEGSFEVGTLGLADARHKLGHHDRFAFFSRENLKMQSGGRRPPTSS